MGFDIGVTDKGFKYMEINSHPEIDYLQMYRPFLLICLQKNILNP